MKVDEFDSIIFDCDGSAEIQEFTFKTYSMSFFYSTVFYISISKS